MSVPARSPARLDADRSAAAGSASGIRLKGGDGEKTRGKRSGGGATAAPLPGVEGGDRITQCGRGRAECGQRGEAMRAVCPWSYRDGGRGADEPTEETAAAVGVRVTEGAGRRRRRGRPGEPASLVVGGVGWWQWQLVRRSDQAAPVVGRRWADGVLDEVFGSDERKILGRLNFCALVDQWRRLG
ncbi:hypothetical protein ABZP36_016373 [Zizania latifolia]